MNTQPSTPEIIQPNVNIPKQPAVQGRDETLRSLGLVASGLQLSTPDSVPTIPNSFVAPVLNAAFGPGKTFSK